MPRGPRSEKRPADVIGAGRYLPWASPKFKLRHRIKELVENLPDLAVLVEPLLIVRRVVREQLGILHRRLLAIVRDDDVCRRLMTIPGVGPVVARDEGPRPAARSPCRRR
jgi:transposase